MLTIEIILVGLCVVAIALVLQRTQPDALSGESIINRRQIEEYVERELGGTTLPGWALVRSDPNRLWWSIKKKTIPTGEWPYQDYGLHVSDDLRWFIVTYGNTDVGLGSLGQEFQQARVISAQSLKQYPLAACLQFMLEKCPPNEWGYT